MIKVKNKDWRCSGVFIVNFEQISRIDFLVSLLLWTSKFRLERNNLGNVTVNNELKLNLILKFSDVNMKVWDEINLPKEKLTTFKFL